MLLLTYTLIIVLKTKVRVDLIMDPNTTTNWSKNSGKSEHTVGSRSNLPFIFSTQCSAGFINPSV
jgi:hypothetical protein